MKVFVIMIFYLSALRSCFVKGERFVALALFGLGLCPQTEVEPGLVAVPDGRDVGRVLGRLVLEVDKGNLLIELGGAVPLLLGVKVELEDPQWSVRATDGVVSSIPDHDLDCPVPGKCILCFSSKQF